MKRNEALRMVAGIAALVLSAGAAMAQPPAGKMDPERMVERQLTAMKERLKLTADQEKKVKPILVDSMKQMMEIRQKHGAPQPGERPSQEAMAAMKKSREETNKKLAEVLTDEQMKEYEKLRTERGPGGPGGRGAERRRPPQ